MKEVIKTLAKVPVKGKRILVLGDMLELGEASAELHARLASGINHDQFKEVYLIGTEIEALQKQLIEQGYPAGDIHYFPKDQQAAMAEALKTDLTADDVVLLKASHGIHLEQTLVALKANN